MGVPRISSILDTSGRPFELPSEVRASQFDVINRWGDTDSWKFATNASGDTTHIRHDRNRATSAARMEYENNPYAKGMVNRLANEVICTGPTLEITPRTSSARSESAAKTLERRWAEHADETNFRQRLWMNVVEPVIGGECFNIFRSNRGLKTVQVEFEQYEGIQFGTPWGSYWNWRQNTEYPYVDGMRLDANGNISEFHKLKYHPGSQYQSASMEYNQYDIISPDVCCHIFRKERPTQYRGISQLTPCVELFAKLRRYTDAVLETAENAASILGSIETSMGIDDCAPGPSSTRRMMIGSAMFMNMPEGWKANPFKAEQPTTTYNEFKNAILHEIMQCLLLPWNQAAGDSSDYNFSSARMDHLIFDRMIAIIRQMLEKRLINRFFDFWMEFAMYTPGIIPTGLGAFDYRWYWPKRVAVDPVKQADANKILKEAGLLDEADYWQSEGMNWKEAEEKKIKIRLWREKRENEMREEMNMPPAPPAPQVDKTRQSEPIDELTVN